MWLGQRAKLNIGKKGKHRCKNIPQAWNDSYQRKYWSWIYCCWCNSLSVCKWRVWLRQLIELASDALCASLKRMTRSNNIAKHLNKVVEGPQHLFATLSNAWLDDSVLVHVPRNQSLAKPIYVVQISTPGNTKLYRLISDYLLCWKTCAGENYWTLYFYQWCAK